MGESEHWVAQRKATELIGEGRVHQRRGELTRAIELYDESLEVLPTAEGYTYRAWARAEGNDYEGAIADCHAAIGVDPSLGNPYNDLGSYLVRLGRIDEAIGWLELAKIAARYDTRHFPYINLGRVYAMRGQLHRAIREFEEAQRLCPADESCTRVLGALRGALN